MDKISFWISRGTEVSFSSSVAGRSGGRGAGKPSRPRTVASIIDCAEPDKTPDETPDVTEDSCDSSERFAFRQSKEEDEAIRKEES